MKFRRGLFSSSETATKAPTPLVARCGACKLYQTCETPKMPVRGKGKLGVMIVGGQPSADDDDHGRPLSDDGGQWLRYALSEMGISATSDCWITHAAICAGDNSEAVNHCRPNLLAAIKERNPKVIILLGDTAIKGLIQHTWGRTVFGQPSRWVGYSIPDISLNAWIIPTYDPKLAVQRGDRANDATTLHSLYLKWHLGRAFENTTRPFKKIPDYNSQVKIVLDENEAEDWIDFFVKQGGPIAFDYEVNCLRPETKGSRIISAAICWRGKVTIAFPITPVTGNALSWLLRRQSIPKIGANIKFEDRWTKAKFQHSVKNWSWDTMLAAHFIDNRPGVTGLKFQAYAQLGVPCYDDHISPFLHSPANSLNQISKLRITDILQYNGMDALLTYRLAQIQKGIICEE